MILYAIFSAFLNCCASAFIALAVGLRRPFVSRNRIFALFCMTVALWSGLYVSWLLAEDKESALLFCRLLMLAAALVPAAYYHFVCLLCERRRNRSVYVGYALALVFIVAGLQGEIVSDVAPKMGFPHWPQGGRFFWPFLAYFSFYTVRTWYVLYQAYGKSTARLRGQIAFVGLGTGIGFLGGSTNYFLWFDLPIPPVGNALVSVYVVCVAYAIIRYRLVEVDKMVWRFCFYVLIVLLTALAMPLVVSLMPAHLIATRASSLWFYYFLAVMVAIGAFWEGKVLPRFIDRFLEETVLRSRYDHHRVLRDYQQQIFALNSDEEIYRKTLTVIVDCLKTQRAAFYERTEVSSSFELRAGHQVESHQRLSDAYLPFLQPWANGGNSWVQSSVINLGSENARSRHGYELIFPVLCNGALRAVLLLGDRKGSPHYSDLDISLVESICAQIGLSMSSRHLERRASESEKLISLGTLAAGLAHELRNPLVSIQTFTALINEEGADAETLREFRPVVQRDVNRIASIVENVAAFAHSGKVELSAVRIDALIDSVRDILRAELNRARVVLDYAGGQAPAVLANHGQLLQVFVNLIQNAVQAIDGRPSGRIAVQADLAPSGGPRPLLLVTIADNGPGIDATLLPRIFEPFTTTKDTGDHRGKGGMGLGLAIVKRIIQYHQGYIEVLSAPGEGTTFRIHLPLFETSS